MTETETQSRYFIKPVFIWLFLLGPLGGHYFYLGRLIPGMIELLLCLKIGFWLLGDFWRLAGFDFIGSDLAHLGLLVLLFLWINADFARLLLGEFRDKSGHKIRQWSPEKESVSESVQRR